MTLGSPKVRVNACEFHSMPVRLLVNGTATTSRGADKAKTGPSRQSAQNTMPSAENIRVCKTTP